MGKATDPRDPPPVRAFCSYAHADNDEFSNTVQVLVADLCSLHEAETGRPLDIFFDREKIGWGEDLRSSISNAVENATFFIPVITARYFRSSWCRDEFLSFYSKCRAIGVDELILPIILAGRTEITEDSPDEIIRMVSSVRYIDWSGTWQHGHGSPPWNLGITELVRRLNERREPVESRLVKAAIQRSEDDSALKSQGDEGEKSGEVELSDRLTEIAAAGQPVLQFVEDVVTDLDTFLGELQQEFDDVEVSDFYTMRGKYDRLTAIFSQRGHLIERNAREAVEQAIEFDALLRGITRYSHITKHHQQAERVAPQLEHLRNRAIKLSGMVRDLNAKSQVLRRLEDASLLLQRSLSPVRAALQSSRDIGHILDGWVSIEI